MTPSSSPRGHRGRHRRVGGDRASRDAPSRAPFGHAPPATWSPGRGQRRSTSGSVPARSGPSRCTRASGRRLGEADGQPAILRLFQVTSRPGVGPVVQDWRSTTADGGQGAPRTACAARSRELGFRARSPPDAAGFPHPSCDRAERLTASTFGPRSYARIAARDGAPSVSPPPATSPILAIPRQPASVLRAAAPGAEASPDGPLRKRMVS
jgi:hypothetical protein